jgi:hypothetical protein
MKASDHRKHIPVGVKLHSCLLLLGYTEEEILNGIDWDHFPALSLRVVDSETGLLVPAANDPRYIRPLRKAEHAVKTFGSGATTAGSDIGNAYKLKRLEKKTAEFNAMLAEKYAGEREKRRSKWAKRPFPKRRASV